MNIRKPVGVVLFLDYHAYHVCGQMRDDEIEQYLAVTGRPEYDWQEAARDFCNSAGVKYTLVDETGEPIMCGGYNQATEGYWHSWMIGTDKGWRLHWRTITKAARWLMQEMIATGARRLETACLTSRVAANKWHAESMGLTLEGVHRKAGRNGEDIAVFAWVEGEEHGRRSGQRSAGS